MMTLVLAAALFLQDDVAGLIQQLASEDIEVRDAAQRKLEALGVKAKAPLRKALETATGEHGARVKAALERLPRLEATLRAAKTRIRLGEDPGLQVRLKNVWDEELWVCVQSVDQTAPGRTPSC